MRKTTILPILCFASGITMAQVRSFEAEKLFPEKNEKLKFHTVSGERHGPSFFKKFVFPEVEYTPGETLTFEKYHTVDVMYAWYEKWATQFPDIVDLYVIGESFEGRPVYQMTLTNKKNRKRYRQTCGLF
ncbi:M14 family zinc carboxypeptidase [Algoriphagus boritolerans]|uniref:M14 family zinc carboxypeptidase n=1 Tax=Algoriphagus boritolerans TaxID=308111 RepID=UPI000B20E9B2